MKEEQQLPLTEKAKFEAKLQKDNRVQVPKIVQWQYKLETTQILKAPINPLGIRTKLLVFLTRN